MKKSKTLLASAMLLTVVTGAFASKAHMRGLGDRYCKTTLNGTCSATKDYQLGGTNNFFCSTISQADCQAQSVSTPNVLMVGE